MEQEPQRAISIVVYDPTGRQSLETYPPNSVWFWNDGRKQRKTRSDAGTGVSAAERQSRSRNRKMSQDKQNLGIEITALTGSEFLEAAI
jgi:uncharacterized protein RhaS with RHS repeats